MTTWLDTNFRIERAIAETLRHRSSMMTTRTFKTVKGSVMRVTRVRSSTGDVVTFQREGRSVGRPQMVFEYDTSVTMGYVAYE